MPSSDKEKLKEDLIKRLLSLPGDKLHEAKKLIESIHPGVETHPTKNPESGALQKHGTFPQPSAAPNPNPTNKDKPKPSNN